MKWVSLPLVALLLTQQTDTQHAIDLLEQALTLLRGTPPVSTSAITHVHAGDNLQAVLNAAQPGDTILLALDGIFTGPFVLPEKTGNAWITLASEPNPLFTSNPSQRVNEQLAELRQSTGPIVATAPRAHHWRLERLHLQGTSGGDLVTLGDGSSAQSTLADVPHDLVLDRVVVQGDPSTGAKRGIALNSASTTITNSVIVDIKTSGQDAQAIAGWNGPGPYSITNCQLEASGENVMFGGADPAIVNLVPTDIVISGNYFEKPLSWQTQAWQIKNLLELKNARRVSITHNVFVNNWAQAQSGYAIVFTERNQSGNCRWCVVNDVLFTGNIVRNVAQGVSITGLDNEQITTTAAGPFNLTDNLFTGLTGSWLQLTNGPIVTLIVVRNSVQQTGNFMEMAGAPSPGALFMNNAGEYGTYGIHGDNRAVGRDSLDFYLPGAVFTNNALVNAPSWIQSAFPATTTFPATASAVVNAGVNLAQLPNELAVINGR